MFFDWMVLLWHRCEDSFKHFYFYYRGFPVAQMVEHGTSNAKIMGSIPRESKSW